MLDAVKATCNGYDRVLCLKLHKWELYISTDYEQLSTSSLLSQLRQKNVNLVTMKGQIFLADGEVRSSSFSSTRNQTGVGEDVLDALIRRDTTMLSQMAQPRLGQTDLQPPRQGASKSIDSQSALQFQHEYKKCMTELHQLEDNHREQVQLQQKVQLQKALCEQKKQFIQDKWNYADDAGAGEHDASGSSSPVAVKNNLPEEELLLHEFTKQYSCLEQKVSNQYEILVSQYTLRGRTNYMDSQYD